MAAPIPIGTENNAAKLTTQSVAKSADMMPAASARRDGNDLRKSHESEPAPSRQIPHNNHTNNTKARAVTAKQSPANRLDLSLRRLRCAELLLRFWPRPL